MSFLRGRLRGPACALFASIAGLALPLTGCGGEDAPNGVPRPDGDLTWAACGPGIECSGFEVAFDDAHPDKGSFVLPAVRLPATGERVGVLLVNPGGPGGSAIGLARATPFFFPPEVLERFDIIAFEPRGAGASLPEIDCTDSLDAYVALDLTPDDPAERKTLLDVNRAIAEGCEKRSGDFLPFIGTDRVARDMDRLRAHLGEEKINYLGYSYGTFLGALYADAFPDRVRTMVLDGAVDPAESGADAIKGQALGFEQELEHFFDDQAKDDKALFHEDGKPGDAYDALMVELDAAPLTVPVPGAASRHLGTGEAFYGVTEALYDRGNWDALAAALAAAKAGQGAALLALSDQSVGRASDGTYDNFFESYLAISSLDTPWPTKIEDYDALADDVRKTAPRLGVSLVYNSILPIFWPVKPWRTPGPLPAKGAPAIVVIGNLGDPATPYASAQALSDELSSGVLLTWTGDGHTAFGGKSKCIDDAVIGYLVDRTAPRVGKSCD